MAAGALSLFHAALANLSMLRMSAQGHATSLRLFPPDSCCSCDGRMTARGTANAADRLASRRSRAMWRGFRVETRPERWEAARAARALWQFGRACVVPRRWSRRPLLAACCSRPSRACAYLARWLACKASAGRKRHSRASCWFDVPVVPPSCCECAWALRWRADAYGARAEAAEAQPASPQAVSSVSLVSCFAS